ncbi:TOM1-like protein 6 [Rutidosis leptorrhynchoides]|uniref:TOM1-like protein 6 n=1 Tax=Rutidosis leptorrhynchoides TaxID=125765 RepID=UPI003A99CDBF
MMPMLPFQPPPSVMNAYARVDKATSEFLNCPDWRINIGICDTINSKPWFRKNKRFCFFLIVYDDFRLAKDYIKAVRGRLHHKNPNVQLLSLTLLETIVKNCSEHVHVQMAERKMLHEMIKIVKKKTHMRVREKILVLIDTWQEAFGSRGGRITSQYQHAYEELRRFGVQFPHRSPNTVPVITPPVSNGGAGSSSRHESTENVNLSALESMRNACDLLSQMLEAVDIKDRKAVKDEIIVDLYNQCRSNQKKMGQTLSTTNDEEILQQGIEFNDEVQYIIDKHDAIANGSPIPNKPSSLMSTMQRDKHIESKEFSSKQSVVGYSSTVSYSSSSEIHEEPSDSASVTSRNKETQTVTSESMNKTSSDPSIAMALVPSDPLPQTNKKTAEEDMIDFLSLALLPTGPSTSTTPNQTPPQAPTVAENQPYGQQSNSYVVPWAQTQLQPEYDPQPQVQTVQQQTNYIPPPWAPTPGYYCNPYASNYTTTSYYNNTSGAGAGMNSYLPSYRLFEDLNVLGNVRTNATPGTSGPSMLDGRK